MLTDMIVAITASRRATELAHLITKFKGIPYFAPTVGIELKQDIFEIKTFIKKIVEENIDYAVFMTGPGVFSLMSAAQKLEMDKILIGILKQTTVIARSIKPQSALTTFGIKTHLVPQENTVKGISNLLKSHNITGKKIAILWHGSYSTVLRDDLYSAGAKDVFEMNPYVYSLNLDYRGSRILDQMGFNYVSPNEAKVIKLIEDIIYNDTIDIITFTSPPSVRDLFKVAERYKFKEKLQTLLNRRVIIVAIGPSTANALKENGIQVDVMPEVYRMGAMIKSLNDYVDQHKFHKKRDKPK
jgi:uroporphyrinogen-III synthase